MTARAEATPGATNGAGGGAEGVAAPSEDVGVCSRRIGRVADLTHRYVDDGLLAGTHVVVTRKGQVVLDDRYGLADVEIGRPVLPDSIWRIYSMTKPIASLALMMLYEQGLLLLEDPVSEFIPPFAHTEVFDSGDADSFTTRPPERPMTVHDVMTHMSGLTAGFLQAHPTDELYRRAGLGNFDRPKSTLAAAIDRLAELPLVFSPGTGWNYGMSTDVVGRIVEVVSGMPLDRYFQENIFEPLGMVDTGFFVPEGQGDRFSAMYMRSGEGGLALLESSERSGFYKPPEYFSGAGGLVSTAADYQRFVQMLVRGGELGGERLIGSRTLAYMAQNHLPEHRTLNEMGQSLFSETSMEGIGFGLGFGVVVDPPAAQNVVSKGEYHWGGAASTTFWVDPVEDLTVLFLTQLLPSNTYPIRRQLRSTVYQAFID